MKRNRLFGLATLVAVAGMLSGLTATAGASSANGSLLGAGSTLIAPLMAQWTADFGNRDNIAVTYGAVGSGAGIAQITGTTVDFGASDAPLIAAQAAACNGCVQIPWALTATGIAFHLHGVAHLRLSGPGARRDLPRPDQDVERPADREAQPRRARSRRSRSPRSTAVTDRATPTRSPTTSRVSAGAGRSQIGLATAVSFPTGVGGKGNDGVKAIVSSTNGAIGYISASYIIAHGLGRGARRTPPASSSCRTSRTSRRRPREVKSVPANNELHIVNPPAKYKTAYPLSTFTLRDRPQGGPPAHAALQVHQVRPDHRAAVRPPARLLPVPHVVLQAGIATAKTLG